MNKRNLGLFRIRVKEFEGGKLEEVVEIFSRLKIVPLKAEYRPDWDAVEYLAIGERFEEVKDNEAAPEYHFVVTKSKAGNIELIEVVNVANQSRGEIL